ncbi:conserved hypothetical protein [Talaromyces stipitatus ATCC 10500]|uniref:Rhodopsin domain-containing protein n=1 Tax=Talaromyces stipitatus (strain ATCC 10500 / CBS 375.48 / QM 6759 / NRRL 1006) TaxID=441959 RepID=B8MCE7_TALSN|nr:uncharacterized protein TSTA_124820 [Talaromyces stipitatus ATCC 10500]EED18763.1 conserved hypothetical protein [Talaromyces stipitatus ATCC 10500]
MLNLQVFDIAQGIATSTATANGYGEHIGTLTDDQVTTVMKSQYAAGILSIVSLASSKVSYVMFVRSITAAPLDRRIALVIIILLSIWGVVSVITVAFQCQPLPTWDYLTGKCYDRQSWQNFFGISNIVSEIVIISQTIVIIARIQTKLKRKLTIGFVFGLRIFVVAAAIAQIVVLNKTFHDPDVTYATWSVSVTNQLVLCSSIITACSAQFKPFLDSLRSSGMRLDALTGSYQYKSQNRYAYGSHIASSKQRSIPLHSLTGSSAQRPENKNSIASETYVSASRPSPDWDAASATSQSQIIRETRTFAVTEEFRSDADEIL